MSTMGVREVVSAREVFGDPSDFKTTVIRENADGLGFLRVALKAAVVGLAALSLTAPTNTGTSIRSRTVGEVAYVAAHLRPTPGVADALASLHRLVAEISAPKQDSSPELKAMALAALDRMQGRQKEPIEAWADRVAKDVSMAND